MIPKFRAWDKRENTMRDVAVLHFTKGGKVNSIEYWKTPSESKSYHVRNLILMQSTGLKDKNGVEIFEGDIVHVLDSEQINQRDENGAFIDAFFEEIDEIDSVVFVDGCFKLKRTGFDVCICRSVEDFTIIGNIYENPELLEVQR
ncbi:MAG: YopX family protein [Enterococcus avium]